MVVVVQDNLVQIIFIVRQCDKRFRYQWIGIFFFGVRNMNVFLGFKCFDCIQYVFVLMFEGDKVYFLLIECGELGIGGKFGVKYKGRFNFLLDFLLKGKEGDYLVIGFIVFDVCGCIKNQFGCGILGKKGQCFFYFFVVGVGLVFF